MKLETIEIITTQTTATLTIAEARLLNTIIEDVFNRLESCRSISWEDLKSYKKNYSPEAIDYQAKSKRDEAALLTSALYLLLKFDLIEMALAETKEAISEMHTAWPEFLPEVYNHIEMEKTREYKKWAKEGFPLVEVKEEDMGKKDRKLLKQNTKILKLLTKLDKNNITDFHVIYK